MKSNNSQNYYKSQFESGDTGPEWKSSDIRGFADVGVTFNTAKTQYGLGIQAGLKTSSQPPLDGIYLDPDIGELKDTSHPGKSTKAICTLYAKAKHNISNHFGIKAKLSLEEFLIGAKIKF